MASRKELLIAAATMAVVVMGALLPAIAWPVTYLVGDQQGWDLGVDYDTWVRNYDPMNVDEALEFVYTLGEHNVVQVADEDSYSACDATNSIQTWDTGDDIVQLPYVGKFYFICGMGDHCNQGMKLAITAV